MVILQLAVGTLEERYTLLRIRGDTRGSVFIFVRIRE